MKQGRAPSPGMDSTRYERPNKDWVCGHTCEGCPCRIGPSPSGECRATTECAPRLVLRPGETKGTWSCTRPADWGGPCGDGPLPDGTCCRAVSRCSPARSLRARRGLASRATVAACIAGLLVGLSGSTRESFINPRPLSLHHSGAEFAHLAAAAGGGQGCVLCHAGTNGGFGSVVQIAYAASRASLRPGILASPHPKDFSRMDRSCLACHEAKGFHHADVASDASCSVCHEEHRGTGPMAPVASQSCVDCHGDPGQMLAAQEKNSRLPQALFARMAQAGQVIEAPPRPARGLTEVITGFAVDHPEFRVLRDKVLDSNTLKFNHRVHLAGSSIPFVNGRPLDCASCHKPDASSAFMGRVSFEQSCRVCHALDFDERNPGMILPHGNPAYVRDYLSSLPVQYADYAARTLGIVGRSAVEAFVRRSMRSLKDRTRSGENLERSVFLSDGRNGPVAAVARLGGSTHARIAGCALCHEVSWRENSLPIVTPPQAPDRWLPGATFNHAKHASMACSECHSAALSEHTSDVLLPTQQSCVRCHSPQGGASDSCTSCHVYHNSPPARMPTGLFTVSAP